MLFRSITNGTPVTFHPVTQNGPIVSYTWTPAADLSCSDCENPSTNIRVNTLYTVRVVNSFGCSAVDSVFITSLCPKAEVFIPNAFTPDGDGLNDVLMVRGSGITVKTFRIFNADHFSKHFRAVNHTVQKNPEKRYRFEALPFPAYETVF